MRRTTRNSTPKNDVWMNQVEIWPSILVRQLFERGDFTAVEQLKAKLLACVECFNRTMAKPSSVYLKGLAMEA